MDVFIDFILSRLNYFDEMVAHTKRFNDHRLGKVIVRTVVGYFDILYSIKEALVRIFFKCILVTFKYQ